jgi:hypothetical protein
MTETVHPTPSLRRRRIVLAAIALVIVLAIAFPTWSWRAAVASGQVDVVPGGMTCDGDAIPLGTPGEDDPGPPEYVVPVKKGMNCQLFVRVVNHSGHAVRVKDMTFPSLMPGHGNAGPVVITGNDSAEKPNASNDRMDATFTFDEVVEPDESIEVVLRLRANPDSCSDAGTARLTNMPSTRLDVMHRPLTVQGSVGIAVQLKTALRGPDCDGDS